MRWRVPSRPKTEEVRLLRELGGARDLGVIFDTVFVQRSSVPGAGGGGSDILCLFICACCSFFRCDILQYFKYILVQLGFC